MARTREAIEQGLDVDHAFRRVRTRGVEPTVEQLPQTERQRWGAPSRARWRCLELVASKVL